MEKNQIVISMSSFIFLFIIVISTIFICIFNFSQAWLISFLIFTILGFAVIFFKNYHENKELKDKSMAGIKEQEENNISLSDGKLLLVIIREFLVENENKLVDSKNFIKAKNINNAYDIIINRLNNSIKHKVNDNKKLFISNEQMSKIIKKNSSLFNEYSKYINLKEG